MHQFSSGLSIILFRVVHITAHENGSGIIINRAGKQYIVTAAHVVEGLYRTQHINTETRRERKKPRITAKEVRSDIAVLKIDEIFDLSHIDQDLIFEDKPDFWLSQDIFLVGYPAGQDLYIGARSQEGSSRVKELKPYIRKGIISNFAYGHEFIVDSLLQKGFSGRPVVIVTGPRGKIVSGPQGRPRVIGIITDGIVFKGDRNLLDDRHGVTFRSGFTSCLKIEIAAEIMQDMN